MKTRSRLKIPGCGPAAPCGEGGAPLLYRSKRHVARTGIEIALPAAKRVERKGHRRRDMRGAARNRRARAMGRLLTTNLCEGSAEITTPVIFEPSASSQRACAQAEIGGACPSAPPCREDLCSGTVMTAIFWHEATSASAAEKADERARRARHQAWPAKIKVVMGAGASHAGLWREPYRAALVC